MKNYRNPPDPPPPPPKPPPPPRPQKIFESPVEFAQSVACTLVNLATLNPPEEFLPFFNGMIANVLGRLPQDYFDKMTTTRPCGQAGCDCHITLQPHVVAMYKALRADWQKHAPKVVTE